MAFCCDKIREPLRIRALLLYAFIMDQSSNNSSHCILRSWLWHYFVTSVFWVVRICSPILSSKQDMLVQMQPALALAWGYHKANGVNFFSLFHNFLIATIVMSPPMISLNFSVDTLTINNFNSTLPTIPCVPPKQKPW